MAFVAGMTLARSEVRREGGAGELVVRGQDAGERVRLGVAVVAVLCDGLAFLAHVVLVVAAPAPALPERFSLVAGCR